MKAEEDYLIKPKRAAELLDVSPRTVVRWIREGRIDAKKFGRVWRISSVDFKRIRKDGL